jgi:hypothetical protein
VCCVSPLLALAEPEALQMNRIRRAGWQEIKIAGNTSNCQLIGYVESRFFDRSGYSPHIYEVSREIRAGFYDREYGIRKVERPKLTKEHILQVEKAIYGAKGIGERE